MLLLVWWYNNWLNEQLKYLTIFFEIFDTTKVIGKWIIFKYTKNLVPFRFLKSYNKILLQSNSVNYGRSIPTNFQLDILNVD